MVSSSSSSGLPPQSETDAALKRSRAFLSERLVPDLRTAQATLDAIDADVAAYRRARDLLRKIDASSSSTDSTKAVGGKKGMGEGEGEEWEDIGVVRILSRGEDKIPLLSLGIGSFYAELENRQARAFITKRLDILDRKRDRAISKVAELEAYIHLASTSITQLENLSRGGSIVDDL